MLTIVLVFPFFQKYRKSKFIPESMNNKLHIYIYIKFILTKIKPDDSRLIFLHPYMAGSVILYSLPYSPNLYIRLFPLASVRYLADFHYFINCIL